MNGFENDDFGEWNGDWFDENGGRALELACSWEPEAYGHRSMDWARRDLILGGIQRDRRNWAFRKLARNRHPEFFQDTFDWDNRDQYGIARARSFFFFHYLSLIRLEQQGTSRDARAAREMMGCCQNLYLARQSDEHRAFRPCRRNRACPFCLTRTAESIYHRFREMPDAQTSIYVLASVTDTVLSLHSDTGTLVPNLRENFGKELRELAADYGASGGVFSFQIGPHCGERPSLDSHKYGLEREFGFAVRGAVLFRLPLDLFCTQFVVDEESIDEEMLLNDLSDIGEAPAVRIGAYGSRDPLRSLIFGEPPGNRATALRVGYEGLFAYQQWHLATPDQWQEFLSATKSTRLLSSWGECYGNRKAPATHRLTLASTRKGEFRKREARRRANLVRASDADCRASSIREQLRPHLQSYHQSKGRWPGRSEIRRLAEESSLRISEREARRVSKMIRRES